ncbi:hypothetical protein CPC16_003693 [Podila verticillata]|nr:hypothetical protein CPC16_003693 [Podila verticillata]
MLQQPLDQGSRTSNSGAHPDAQGREGCDFASEEDKQAYGEEEDYEYYDEDDYYEDEDDDLDDVYGDFSVNTKSPPRAKPKLTAGDKPIRSLSNSISQNHQHQPDSTNIRPIPPEILHQIFSYVDHPTLYRGISRVSRQFNAIAKHHIELVGIWTLRTQKEEDDLLEKLRSGAVNVLKVQSSNGQAKTTGRLKPYDRWHWAWQRFVGFITDPIYNNRTLPDTSDSDVHLSDLTAAISTRERDPKQPCLLNRVKKVILDNAALPDLLPHLHRIHTLEFNIKGAKYDLALQPILKTCSNLDTLTIHGHSCARNFICWNKDTDTDTEAWINSHITHFSITEVTFSQETIEEFLGACPRLTFFKATDVHIRSAGVTSSDPPLAYNVPSLPIEPLYRQAAFLCPRLRDFSLTLKHPFRNCFDEQLALTAELFPYTQHLDVTLSLTKDWSADPITCSFLAQLNSIAFVGKEACNEDMDSLLRHCRRLTCLSAPEISYTRPPQKTPPNVDKGVRAALAVAEQRRHTFSTPQERKDYHWRHQIPIARDHHQKLLQRVEKKLVREEIMSRRHQHLASSWRCPRLRVLELRIGTAKQEVSAEGYEDVFRFLGHAFPNLDQLTLHLDALWVGQEIQIEHTTRELRTMTFENNFKGQLSSYTRSWHEDVKTKVWQGSPNALRMLGRLSRLERLIVYVNKVPGVLCPSHFAFLRGAGYRGREQDGVAEPQFCPRLQSIVISSSMTIAFGKTREELFRERQLVNALKTMRPEVTVSFN